jgi:hypothetical protein
MPDFKPRQPLTPTPPWRPWWCASRNHGYLWVVERVTGSRIGVVVRSVATGETGAFKHEEIIGADDD